MRNSNNVGKLNTHENKGSITVFLTVILLSVILFTGSMVDISRLMVADNKMDSAIRAATKSLMSDYDENLIGAYGLFGNNIEANKDDFAKYMANNLELSSNGFMNYELVDDSIQVSADGISLSNIEAFQQQIRDYMRIKAWYNIGESAVGRFINVLGNLDESRKLVEEKTDSYDVENKIFGDDYEEAKDSKEIQKAIGQIEKDQDGADAAGAELAQRVKVETGTSENVTAQNTGKEGQEKDKLKGILSEMKKKSERIEALEKEINAERSKGESCDWDLVERLEDEQEKEKQKYKELAEEGREYYSQDSSKAKEGKNEKAANESAYNSIIDGFKTQDSISYAFKRYLESNSEAEKKGEGDDDSLYSSTKNAKDNAVQKLDALKSIKQGITDHIYNIEYAKDRFTYAISDGRKLSNPKFKNSEIEYLLIGNSTPYANIAAVGTEIFAICFACNFLDCLMTGLVAGIKTVIIAAAMSFKNLKDLYTGDKVFLFERTLNKLPETVKDLISLSYLDFLDLLLRLDYLVIGEERFLQRMQNIIGFNCFYDVENPSESTVTLQDMKTTVKTTAAADVNLMFLPMFPLEAMGIKGFTGTKYRITKTYEFKYQEIAD